MLYLMVSIKRLEHVNAGWVFGRLLKVSLLVIIRLTAANIYLYKSTYFLLEKYII